METIVSILIPALYVVGLIVERLFPARPLPKVRFWVLKGLVFFLLAGFLNSVLPALFAMWLGERTPLHLAWLGTVPGAIVGALAADFVGYWVHRGMHNSKLVWRWTHQMHHSAERMDVAGMSYAHPLDSVLTFGLTGLATYVLGLSPAAAALSGLFALAASVVQHSNVRTPQWIGRVVMRPEMHALHHERGIHAYNYATFPLWDQVFGTFRNPEAFPEHYGFWDGASKKLGAMIVGRDVGQPAQ